MSKKFLVVALILALFVCLAAPALAENRFLISEADWNKENGALIYLEGGSKGEDVRIFFSFLLKKGEQRFLFQLNGDPKDTDNIKVFRLEKVRSTSNGLVTQGTPTPETKNNQELMLKFGFALLHLAVSLDR